MYIQYTSAAAAAVVCYCCCCVCIYCSCTYIINVIAALNTTVINAAAILEYPMWGIVLYGMSLIKHTNCICCVYFVTTAVLLHAIKNTWYIQHVCQTRVAKPETLYSMYVLYNVHGRLCMACTVCPSGTQCVMKSATRAKEQQKERVMGCGRANMASKMADRSVFKLWELTV